MSHLLNLAIRGAKKLIENGRFTEPGCVANLLEQYRRDNSSVISWIDVKDIELTYLTKLPCDYVYEDFREWYMQARLSAMLICFYSKA